MLLHVGITDSLFSAEDGWEGLSITIERPDGKTEVISNIRTDSTGGTGRVYIPNMVGTYYVQMHFPGQWYNKTYVDFFGNLVKYSAFYEASDSEKLALIVQQEPIPYHPGISLPTEYWTRPIDSQAREWYTMRAHAAKQFTFTLKNLQNREERYSLQK